MKRTLLLLVALLMLACPALADYDLTDLTIDIDVGTDGAGLYEEHMTYVFDDSYNGIFITLRHADGLQLSDVRLTVDEGRRLDLVDKLDGVPYTYTMKAQGESTVLQAFAPGEEGVRRFQLTYRIGGLAKRYLDTGRINHVLLYGDNHIDKVTYNITLPGKDAGAIDAFVHGALTDADMRLQNGVLTLGPAAVAKGKALEVDILFPEGWLSQARPIDANMRDEALAQEAAIAQAAADRAAEAERQAQILLVIILVALVVYTVATFLSFLGMRRKYGVRTHIIPTVDDVMLLGITAVEAQALKDGSVSSSGLSATLIELTERGVLAMENTEDDTLFRLVARPDDLTPHQNALLDWLFADADELSIASLDMTGDVAGATEFNNQYNGWKAQVMEDVYARGLRFRNSGARTAAILCTLFIGLAITFFLAREGVWPLAIPAFVITAGMTFLFTRIRKITDDGEAHIAAIDGFLQNYAVQLEIDPHSVLGHTPLLMALGYLEPLANWLDAHPGVMQDSWDMMPPYWAYAGWHHAMVRMDDNVRDAQSNNVGIQSTGNGSDSGGSSGGGFSGGSGGGSSYGAW